MTNSQLFSGSAVQLTSTVQEGLQILELTLDLKNESVNKLNQLTLSELKEAVSLVSNQTADGLIVKSAKDVFVVGADITEFLGLFKKPQAELKSWLMSVHDSMNALEDLSFPSVVLINGYALGGGFELALSCDFRLALDSAKIGLPEVKLGLYPGWGGCVRLPRLIGPDNAIEWITSGKEFRAADALKMGAIDGVVSDHKALQSAALAIFADIKNQKRDYKQKRALKVSPVNWSAPIEAMMTFEISKGFVASMSGPHYPAPLGAIDAIQKTAHLDRAQAQSIEADGFVALTQTQVAESLVRVFLSDQAVKKSSKKRSVPIDATSACTVLGAGIMGGGVAYQGASCGVPFVMKDIQQKALDLGMEEASKLILSAVEKGKLKPDQGLKTLSLIRPTLNLEDIKGSQMVIEAVVENEKVKQSVLAEVESLIGENAVLASNTSTISIDTLAKNLKRPENFCGMHFFNPVHRMPLVEIIRGSKTSEETIGKTVALALKLKKTPIVVRDCPGFLVNRVLFPYFAGFLSLLQQGVSFLEIDRAMEKWGWPMGPAYLLDVVGLDTAVHASHVMAAGFPSRMGAFAANPKSKNPLEILLEAKRLGQKSKSGFYKYEIDKKGKLKKTVDPAVFELLGMTDAKSSSAQTVEDSEIVDRMMLPMAFEAVHCLDEKISERVHEVDLALLYGLGFPPHVGGIFQWIDRNLLSDESKKRADARASELGALYKMPESLMKRSQPYYGDRV